MGHVGIVGVRDHLCSFISQQEPLGVGHDVSSNHTDQQDQRHKGGAP